MIIYSVTIFLGRYFMMSTSIWDMMGFTFAFRYQWIYFSISIFQIIECLKCKSCSVIQIQIQDSNQILNNIQTPMPKFSIKSGKDALDIEHTPTESFEDFQAKVFALTDIPPKNLKVLFKGKMIKDNQSLFQVPQGSQLIIMGTKSGKQLKQTGQIKIDSIMIDENKKQDRYGLTNIGNTCYMNASIQFLKSVPKINKLIRNIKPSGSQSSQVAISSALSKVLADMDKKDVQPKLFVGLFLNYHPQFQPFGKQHDADQFMQRLIQDLSGTSAQNAKILRQQFQIQIQNTLKNTEIPQQPPQVTLQTTTKIGCNLGGNDKDTKVGTLRQGIKIGLETKLQKKSPIDNVNHIYTSQSRFCSLPQFLIVQMVRFFWKEVNDPDSQFNKPQATKICRVVDFGAKLDVFDFCSEQLKKKLQVGRDAYEKNKANEEQQYKKHFEQYKKSLGDTNKPQTRLMADFKQKWKEINKPLNEGLETGMYEISAVVTHLGNSVQSGHYMAWIKDSEDEWIKYDDDSVYPQAQEKVFQLRGGQPNLQIAYLLMFRKVYTKPI